MKSKVDNNAGSDAWWSVPPEGWAKASDPIFKHWQRYARSTPKLEDDVALRALRFGYGARDAYGEHLPWADLKALLEADWALLDKGKHPWADVQTAVKQGWEAAANLEPIRGQSWAAESPAVESQDEANVPGGRMDIHDES